MLPGLAVSEQSVHVGFVIVGFFKNFMALLCNKATYKKINMVPEACESLSVETLRLTSVYKLLT